MKTCEECDERLRLLKNQRELIKQQKEEIEKLKAGISELNIRLHERTQGFLSRSGPFKR